MNLLDSLDSRDANVREITDRQAYTAIVLPASVVNENKWARIELYGHNALPLEVAQLEVIGGTVVILVWKDNVADVLPFVGVLPENESNDLNRPKDQS